MILKTYSANATILMRVGELGKIKDCYEKGKISFGCPLEGVFDKDTYGFLEVCRESAEQLSRRMLDEASLIN